MRQRRHTRGVALLAALLVLFVMSILAIGILMNVDEDLKIAKNSENSERALKIAEAGVQIARASFYDINRGSTAGAGTTELSSVTGFIHGGYFLTQMKAGFIGQEKWPEWRYDMGLSGNNKESEIAAPIMKAWFTESTGQNGNVNGGFYDLKNMFSVVAGGTYLTIEAASATSIGTVIRFNDEYSGSETKNGVWIAPTAGSGTADKTLNRAAASGTLLPVVAYSARASAITSYSDYDIVVGQAEPELIQQTLYLTYAGNATAIASGAADTTSTVRLRAINVINANAAIADNADGSTEVASLWEFDTGIHGVGTPPALFDPTPDASGDEILYFAVVAMGNRDLHYATNLFNSVDGGMTAATHAAYPSMVTEAGEQIYLFAVVDTTGTGSPGYVVKWATPFPDPAIATSTTYATEHAPTPATIAGRPSDLRAIPELDLLADYRDGAGDPLEITTGGYGRDGQYNLVRGNVVGGYPQAVSPPMLNVYYQDSSGQFTTNRADADAGQEYNQNNPLIDIYLMYAQHSRVVDYKRTFGGTSHMYPDPIAGNGISTVSWGPPGRRKPNTTQVRVLSLRDRLKRSGGAWNWNHASSRFPEFKWMYRVPAWDPAPTDTIHPNDYGEYSWDTWFVQQIAPMIQSVNKLPDSRTAAGAVVPGAALSNVYSVIYPYYKSMGYPTIDGYNRAVPGPTTAQGASANFSGQFWDLSKIMMMAVRDTWEDYRTGTADAPYADYWTYDASDTASGPLLADYAYPADATLTAPLYNAALGLPFVSGVRTGLPKPYVFDEDGWTVNVAYANVLTGTFTPAEAYATSNLWGLQQQGWLNVLQAAEIGQEVAMDLDIEGETAAMCKECLDGDGLIILPFNVDTWNYTFAATDNGREDLRIHAINARTGRHIWDFHAAASLSGDNANSTPAIANNKVFFAYMMYDADASVLGPDTANPNRNRQAFIEVLDINDGRRRQGSELRATVDQDADAIIMSPSVANGMVYVATYDFQNNMTPLSNDIIRMYALTPMLRLVSTGIYPKPYENFTSLSDADLLTKHDELLTDTETDYSYKSGQSSRRRIQVWINGESSRWEEVKETVRE